MNAKTRKERVRSEIRGLLESALGAHERAGEYAVTTRDQVVAAMKAEVLGILTEESEKAIG